MSLRWRNSAVPGGSHVPTAADFLDPNAHQWGRARGGVYVAFGRGDVAAATLFYNKPQLIPTMQRLVAHDPQFRPVYLTPDYSIYHWLPPVERHVATAAGSLRRGDVRRPAGGRWRDDGGRAQAKDDQADEVARRRGTHRSDQGADEAETLRDVAAQRAPDAGLHAGGQRLAKVCALGVE